MPKYVENVASEKARELAKKSLEPMTFRSGGRPMPNRFMLAPMTNSQSYEDGKMSEEEYLWLTKRAEGGHGATMTCASHVQPEGKAFPGQLGCWSDDHLEGLTRMAEGIKKNNSVALVQVQHGGMRCPEELIGCQPLAPSDDEEWKAREMTLEEVKAMRDAFIQAAVRCQKAGFDGVELHGAHGYVLCNFLSPENNRRKDEYGPGDAETLSEQGRAGRMRLLLEIIKGVREATQPDFILGVRLSVERFGMKASDVLEITRLLLDEPIDFMDISCWDVHKPLSDSEPEFVKPGEESMLLMDKFLALPRGDIRMGVAGKIKNVEDVALCIEHGADFVLPGRISILEHDWPRKIEESINTGKPYMQPINPVSSEYLASQFLSPKFIEYMSGWKGFVGKEEE
mmetsp:Transcript_12657/g.27766  ORF Transcript_12657/g.27766 Transcript_12657/m.27766 type:complete len:398 (-) Transcript_12657:526-1719(-)|eukprot:CAMPEP_0206450206 /NCGR_PEP_ID=MMETSP0324_2-20121206/18571_1 /ASSEMBLY_ACC=CAM_ASM_000836 /TAXON_ID=2866 /ORGANISM="Crypthecodinium cohnii, Strain Seligo" /LENGTH=397 /DNA_ID=CAMNT_0053919779 /DNA_START=69 /DNA_END=1262 /DNA_ORIENTATION=+